MYSTICYNEFERFFNISYQIFIDIACLQLHNYCNKNFKHWNKKGNMYKA